nr:reverse transcriptase domain-containing protein [Tanacetum cinerariifolium]
MCRKQPPQITIKETLVFDPKWLLTKSDLPVSLPIRITKTISIGEIILIKTEEEILTSLISTSLCSIKANLIDLSQGQSTQNQFQNIQNQYQNLQNQTATLTKMMPKLVNANTASSSGSGTLPVSEPVVAPVSALIPNLKPSIPYPSRRDNEKRRDQANEQIKKFYEIFKDMSFKISFTDALILMPKFASTLKALIGNKEKLNLNASINLMPLSVWEGLSLPELTPTCMMLELADRSVSKPISITKDVSFKVRVFYFPADFVVVDFKPDPRVPLILGRRFLKTSRALIDVHKGELTLRIGNEAITYNLDQTVRYSANYNQMTANKIDVIESACEEYSQEVLDFSNVTDGGTPIPQNDPIVSITSPTLTPFGDSDFLLFEEADAFLGLEDDPDLPKINLFYYDPKGDILLLEAILNSEPSPPPPKWSEGRRRRHTTVSGNPTPIDDLIVSTTSPALTPFGDSDFLLFEEADAFLGLEDDPDSPKINPFYYDPEGDILLLEAILNSEPLPLLLNHEQYLPSYKKELKVCVKLKLLNRPLMNLWRLN